MDTQRAWKDERHDEEEVDISAIEKEIQLYGRILHHNNESGYQFSSQGQHQQLQPPLPHQQIRQTYDQTPRTQDHPATSSVTNGTRSVGMSPAYWSQAAPVYRSSHPITPLHRNLDNDPERISESNHNSNRFNAIQYDTPGNEYIQRQANNNDDHQEFSVHEHQGLDRFNENGNEESTTTDSGIRTEGDRQSHTFAKKGRYRRSTERVRAEVEMKRQKECTFKPRINKYSSNKAEFAVTGEKRIQMLAQNRRKALEERDEMRRRKEEEDAAKYPYHPNVKGRKRSNPQETIERLSREAERRQEMRERTQREHEQQEAKQYPFRPQINHSHSMSDLRNYKPIHERVGELQRQKSEQIHQLRLQEYVNPELTFAPNINTVSESLAQTRNHSLSFQDRITREIAQEKERQYRLQEMQTRKMSEQHPFKPSLSKNTKRIVQHSSLFRPKQEPGTVDFLSRQEAYEARNRTRQEIDIHGIREKPKFKPTISATSQLIVESKLERAGESEQEKLQRWASKDRQKTEALKECIRDQYFSQYNFQPEINQISKIVGRPTDINELANNRRNAQLKKHLAEAVEKDRAQQHPFKPKLVTDPELAKNSKYRIDPKSSEKIMQRINDMKREKEKKIEQSKKIMQYEEMQGCTFQPSRDHTRDVDPSKISKKTVVVPGLGKHLERVETAKKLKEERDEREKKAFEIKSYNDKNGLPYTVPKPFKLSSKNNSFVADMRRKEIEEKWRQQTMRECTFYPQTNDMQSNVMLDFMDEDDHIAM